MMETNTRALTRTLITGSVSYVHDDDTVREAAECLARDNVGALPVYDSNKRLTGIVTDRDIVVRVVARGKDAAQTKVSELATPAPVTIGPDEPISEAVRLMSEHKVRRLPVVEGGDCIGIVSQADIARAMPPQETGKLLENISTD
jgi:CBS domain-containing protein